MWATIEAFPFSHIFIFWYLKRTHNTIDILNAQAHSLVSFPTGNHDQIYTWTKDPKLYICYSYIVHWAHRIIQASFWQSFNNERGFCVHHLDCQCLTLLSTNKRASTNLGIQLDIIVRFFDGKSFLFFWFFISYVCYSHSYRNQKLFTICLDLFLYYMLINFIYYLHFDFGIHKPLMIRWKRRRIKVFPLFFLFYLSCLLAQAGLMAFVWISCAFSEWAIWCDL